MTFEPATAKNTGPITLYIDTTPDVTTWLPEGAADKLRALRQHIADLHVLIPPFEERQAANTARLEAEQRLKRLQDHPHDGGFNLNDDDPRVVDAKRNLEKATADAKRINDRYEMRSEQWHTAGATLSKVEAWLRDGRPGNTTLEVFEDREPSLQKGESITDAIERLRHRGRELRADLHRIQSAPFPSSHAKQQMRAQIETLAQRGAVNVSRLIERDGPVEFLTQQLMVPVRNAAPGAVGFAEVTDTLALLAWLHKSALIAALDREIDSESDDPASLSPADRQKREAEVMADLLSVERDETALTWQAQAQNLPVEHRSDINPLALLGLRLVTASPVNGRGTSLEHALTFVGVRG